MKHGTLVVAAIVSIFTGSIFTGSIFTMGNPLVFGAGGRSFSPSRSSGGGGRSGGSNWGGGGSNWGGGRSNNNGQYSPNQQTYQGSNQYYQTPNNNRGWTQQNAQPWTQQNSAPSIQSNSTPWLQQNSVTTYKPTQGVTSMRVVPLSNQKMTVRSMQQSPGGGLNLTSPGSNNPGAGTNNPGGGSNNPGGGANNPGGGANNPNSGTNHPGSGSGSGGKGGKGTKFAFAIVGGQLVQVVPSDDGSWVTAAPGATDGAQVADGQSPVDSPVAGQDPSAAITLLNPLETRGTVNFSLASETGSLQPGYAAQAIASDPQLIVFDRGGSFGQAQYTLQPGSAYRFAATEQGWDLRTVAQ